MRPQPDPLSVSAQPPYIVTLLFHHPVVGACDTGLFTLFAVLRRTTYMNE